MTPEKARELLRFAVDGPWEERPSEHCDCCFDVVSEDGVVVIAQDSHNCDAPLIAAAPDLAELVAGLRYEYAVQVNGREWLRENDEGRFVLTGDPMRALRHYHPGVAAAIAKGASVKFSCECRVVRRLVSDPEVTS